MQFYSSSRQPGIITAIFSRVFSLVVVALLASPVWAKDCFVYFGTFTDTSSKGIYVSKLDMDTGKLSAPELAIAADSPNYLAISEGGRFLYAVSRGDSKGDGAVCAFSRDNQTGSLKLLDKKSSGGNGPCYVGIDAHDRCVVVANYNGGDVKSFHLNADGTLTDSTVIQHHGSSVNHARQAAPHPHCFVAAPGGRFVLACDLGTDKVMVYRVNAADAALTPNDPPYAVVSPGSGPRHIAFSPDGKTVCVVSEMASTVTVFNWDETHGKLSLRQTLSLLPPGQHDKTFTAAEIAYRPDGRFVYATIRGHNSVSVLAVNNDTGDLSLVQNLSCGGNFPRGMGIDPSGRWLIVGNQKSETVTVFGINPGTGDLTPTGQVLNVGTPVDVKFAVIH
jgi:6-phosphogluconolactonase